MKRLVIIALTVLTLSSCSKEENVTQNELVGKWKLVEQYSDIGDGNVNFQSINSKRTIEFFTNGTVETNGTLCSMSSEVGETTQGIFDDKNGTITPKELCSTKNYNISYKFVKGKLELWYNCKEGCAQKFEK